MSAFYSMWAARDLNGALRLFDEDPVWGGTMWLKPNQGTWVRKLVSTLFPELKPGEKAPLPLGPLGRIVRAVP